MKRYNIRPFPFLFSFEILNFLDILVHKTIVRIHKKSHFVLLPSFASLFQRLPLQYFVDMPNISFRCSLTLTVSNLAD